MKFKQYMVLGAGLAVLLPMSQVADTTLQCTTVEDNALRLACYGRVYAAQLPPVKPLPAAMEKVGVKAPVDLKRTVSEGLEEREAVIVFDKPEHNVAEEGLHKATESYSPLSAMYDSDKNNTRGILSVCKCNPMYLLPVWYNSSPNYSPHSPTRGTTPAERLSEQKRAEVKMQVSFKSKVEEDLFKGRADLWFGYIQKSDWQIYNQGRKSVPSRNIDYEPEIFIAQPVKADPPFGGKLRMIGAGSLHTSDGQSRPESCLWNRVHTMADMEQGRLTLASRLWLPVFDKSNDGNDNPDIKDYMGYGDLKVQYRLDDKKNIYPVWHYNPKTGHGVVEVAYIFPLKGRLKGAVRGFRGYGEGLIDYNHKQDGIGIGLMFNDWDGT